MSRTEELTTKQKFLNGIANFLQKNRIIFIILGIVILVGLAGLGVYGKILSNAQEESTKIAEKLLEDFDDWSSSEDDSVKVELEAQIDESFSKLKDSYSNSFAFQRGNMVMGSMAFEKEQYAEAAEYFSNIHSEFQESYLAPIALINYAVCLEEQDMKDDAIEAYASMYSEYKESYLTAKALFSAGRVAEKLSKNDDALTYYKLVVDSYPESNWTNFARSRIISLNSMN